MQTFKEYFQAALDLDGDKNVDIYVNPQPVDIKNIKAQGSKGINIIVLNNGLIIFWSIENSIKEVLEKLQQKLGKNIQIAMRMTYTFANGKFTLIQNNSNQMGSDFSKKVERQFKMAFGDNIDLQFNMPIANQAALNPSNNVSLNISNS